MNTASATTKAPQRQSSLFADARPEDSREMVAPALAAPPPPPPLPAEDGSAPGSVVGTVVRAKQRPDGWSVLTMDVGGENMAWVGVMPPVREGQTLMGIGSYEVDKYRGGLQLKVDAIVPHVVKTVAGIETYLAGKGIKGIGKGIAKKIVQHFGLLTIDILDINPDRIAEVKGVTPAKAAEIAESWEATRAEAAVAIFLLDHGATPSVARKIVERYGKRARWIVENNPYKLAEDINGIGFKKADEIAKRVGVAHDSPERAQAGTLFVLGEQTEKGHCFTFHDDLVKETAKLLMIAPDKVKDAIVKLIEERKVVRCATGPDGNGDPAIYSEEMHRAETYVARRLLTLRDSPLAVDADSSEKPVVKQVGGAIKAFEEDAKIRLAPAQREAVELAAHAKVMVLTGGPGCGKTACTKAILGAFRAAKVKVKLAAPTGRAAKRLSEATGQEATTIHRMLGFNPETKGFLYTAHNPIPDCGALLLDETSMCDVQLTRDVLAATPSGARVIFVGDVDQLPSVGPGAVLRDVIDSGEIKTVRLTQIFRQDNGSQIIEQAHRINRGEMPVGDTTSSGEFYWIEREEESDAAETVIECVTSRIPRRFGITADNIQVLTPMHKGDAGTIELNKRLQAVLNPSSGPELRRGDHLFRIGDRVIHKKNDAMRDVYNGDIGHVVSVNPDDKDSTLVAQFDGRLVNYTSKQVIHLKLAYALSTHSSQGGQFDAVVQVLLRRHYTMLSRNLLYTGVTRGKKLVVMVADRSAVRTALSAVRKEDRRTMLRLRLQGGRR